MKAWLFDLLPAIGLIFVGFALVHITLVVGELSDEVGADMYWQNVDRSAHCAGASLSDMSVIYVADTGSMRPYVNDDDLLLYVHYNASVGLSMGDSVVVQMENHTRFHRVTGMSRDYFTMKGDNNRAPDGQRYSYDDVLYVVCGVVRGGVSV